MLNVWDMLCDLMNPNKTQSGMPFSKFVERTVWWEFGGNSVRHSNDWFSTQSGHGLCLQGGVFGPPLHL